VHQAAATPPASRRKRQQTTLPAKPRASPDGPARLAGSNAARSTQGDDDRTRVVLGSNLAKNRLSIGLSAKQLRVDPARCPIECPIAPGDDRSKKWQIPLLCGIEHGEIRTRTGDTTIFRA
jgi:hypothetical protein